MPFVVVAPFTTSPTKLPPPAQTSGNAPPTTTTTSIEKNGATPCSTQFRWVPAGCVSVARASPGGAQLTGTHLTSNTFNFPNIAKQINSTETEIHTPAYRNRMDLCQSKGRGHTITRMFVRLITRVTNLRAGAGPRVGRRLCVRPEARHYDDDDCQWAGKRIVH